MSTSLRVCVAWLLVAPSLAVAHLSSDVPDIPANRATVQAFRLLAPLQLDGRLDEEIYAGVPPTGGFIQQLPREGLAASEPTDLWVLFDDHNIYVALRGHDSQPSRIVANELRRDSRSMFQLNDNVTVVFDTFYDKRNGFFFQTNPPGAVARPGWCAA